jgi:hypothetical protein
VGYDPSQVSARRAHARRSKIAIVATRGWGRYFFGGTTPSSKSANSVRHRLGSLLIFTAMAWGPMFFVDCKK